MSFKDRMYDFEVAPPEGTWKKILDRIEGAQQYGLKRKENKIVHFSLSLIAACLVLFLFVTIFFQIKPEAYKNSDPNLQLVNTYSISDGFKNSNSVLNKIISKNAYITIEGPKGKMKISSKVAALIISPETPSKTEWNKKLAHWKNMMMTASNTNFMDVIPITQLAESEN